MQLPTLASGPLCPKTKTHLHLPCGRWVPFQSVLMRHPNHFSCIGKHRVGVWSWDLWFIFLSPIPKTAMVFTTMKLRVITPKWTTRCSCSDTPKTTGYWKTGGAAGERMAIWGWHVAKIYVASATTRATLRFKRSLVMFCNNSSLYWWILDP